MTSFGSYSVFESMIMLNQVEVNKRLLVHDQYRHPYFGTANRLKEHTVLNFAVCLKLHDFFKIRSAISYSFGSFNQHVCYIGSLGNHQPRSVNTRASNDLSGKY